VIPYTTLKNGQQRIPSLYYAIKAPDFALNMSIIPLYFYVDFSRFLQTYEKRK